MSTENYFALQWHITEKCDQRCKHCYLYAGKDRNYCRDLDLNTLKSILDNFISFCKKVNVKPSIAVTGGDPLLYHDIWNFLELLHSNNVPFSILGNPFHLDLTTAKRLKKLGCISYQMSLDGCKETHDYIRKKGSFDETISKIVCLKDADIPSSIMTTVSKSNIDEIPKLVDTVVSSGVDRFIFARYCPNPSDYELLPSPDEYKNFLEIMWKKYESLKNSDTIFILKDHLWYLYLYEHGMFDISEIYNPDDLICDGCGCRTKHMAVLTDGTVYACRRCPSPIGKVPESSFYDIFYSKKMDVYRQYDKFEACSKCELKNFCRGCPAVAKCLTGDFYSKDPQCWKVF